VTRDPAIWGFVGTLEKTVVSTRESQLSANKGSRLFIVFVASLLAVAANAEPVLGSADAALIQQATSFGYEEETFRACLEDPEHATTHAAAANGCGGDE